MKFCNSEEGRHSSQMDCNSNDQREYNDCKSKGSRSREVKKVEFENNLVN